MCSLQTLKSLAQLAVQIINCHFLKSAEEIQSIDVHIHMSIYIYSESGVYIPVFVFVFVFVHTNEGNCSCPGVG